MSDGTPEPLRDELPRELKVEVKTSRNQSFALSDRDLEGIKPDGFAAILVDSPRNHGPRWILVEGRRLTACTHDEESLLQAEQDGSSPMQVVAAINRIWSNWILDREAWHKLFQQQNMPLNKAVKWMLETHPLKQNRATAAVREMKLGQALTEFRQGLDKFLANEQAAQQEGQVHQYILEHAIQQLGYDVTNNPIGVPDFNAVLRQSGPGSIDNAVDAAGNSGALVLPGVVKRWLAAQRPIEGSAESFIEQVLGMSDQKLGAELESDKK